MKRIVVILTIVSSFFIHGVLNAQNPKSICITCGRFDLAKINFSEDINVLAVQNKSKTVLSGQQQNNQTKLYETFFLFKDDKGKNPEIITYQNWFTFNNVRILSNDKSKIIAFAAFNFYDRPMSQIDAFVNQLKNKFKSSAPKIGKLVDGAIVYQWFLNDVIVQLERDTKQEVESTNVNGKWVDKKTCHVKLTVFNKALLDDKMKISLARNINFLFYQKEHFKGG